MLRKAACSLLVTLLLAVSTAAQTAPAPQAKVNLIIDRETIRFAPQELAVEMRLLITDESGAPLYDSGPLSVSTLDWLLRDGKGEAVKGGLYLYKLSLKDAAGAVSERHGYLIVNRTGDADRVYIATGEQIGIGPGKDVSSVTVVSGPEATIGRAELPANVPQRTVNHERGTLPERVTDETQASKPYTKLSLAGTLNRIAKFDSNGNLIDSAIFDQNNKVSVGGTTSYGALTLIGNVPSGDAPAMALYNQGGGGGASVAIDFYNTFANGNIPQAKIKAVDDGAYSDHLTFWTKVPGGPNNPVAERLRITSTGNVGIGTTNPTAPLHLAVGSGREITLGTPNGEVGMALVTSGGRADIRYNGALHLLNGLGGPPPATNGIVVNTDGKVGIGTTAPNHQLKISGGPLWTTAAWVGALELDNGSAIGWRSNGFNSTVGIGASNGNLYLFSTSSYPGETGGAAVYDFTLTNTGLVGIGTTTPDQLLSVNGNASKVGGGSWANFSDERLKNVKGHFTSGLQALMRLQPIRYEYKPDNALSLRAEGDHIGFSAQAVQQVIPEAVITNDKGYLLVNNDPILWTMLNAIKEQQHEIEVLKRQVRQLQGGTRKHSRQK